jgi:ABC-type transport system involved in multi-copper enzyme maturation permease subunit
VIGFTTILLASLREHIRRRSALVALVLGAVFVILYALGTHFIWKDVSGEIARTSNPVRAAELRQLVPATLFGLAIFATWFLAAVAATFLAAGGIRGEAEHGILQHVLVRPVARHTVLAARLSAAAILAITFLVAVLSCCALVTRVITGWMPGNIPQAFLLLALGTFAISSVAVAVSVRLHGAAAGIATLMLFGTGLIGGLLEQLGQGIKVSSVQESGEWVSTLLPFEAMYQAALHEITSDISGVSGVIVRLGPFGGARETSIGLILWTLAWSAAIIALATRRLRRSDF